MKGVGIELEIETGQSKEIIDFFHDLYALFANQDMLSYAIILLWVALFIFALVFLFKMHESMKHCYEEVDHKGFRLINILNLVSVILGIQIITTQSLIMKIFCGIFLLSVIRWFYFMVKLFILNIKQYSQKKNFVKKQKKRANAAKLASMGHRISKNDLIGVYEKAEDMYKDCQSNMELENREFQNNRKSLKGKD